MTIGEGPAARFDPRRSRGKGAVDHAVGGDDAGKEHFRDRLDDAGAADAGDAGRCNCGLEARLVRPEIAADHLVLRLERFPVDPQALDRARRGALARGDLRALEGRPGRRGTGDQPPAVAENDLGVGADVDEEGDLVLFVGRLGKHHAGAVGADMAGDQGKRVDPGPGRDMQTEVMGARVIRPVDGQSKGCSAEFDRIEAEEEVVHDRIADRGHLDDPVALDAGVTGDLADELIDRGADDGGHLRLAARMHHHVGDAAHQILAEADLRVHHAGRGERLAADEVGEMGGDGGRADIDGDAEHPVDKARPQADDLAAGADGDRHLPGAGAKRLLEDGEHGKPGAGADDLPLVGERHGEAAKIARRIVHVGLGHLDIVKADDGIERDDPRVSVLADDLTMDLAFLGDVDDRVAEDLRLAAEPPPEAKRAALLDIALLDPVPAGQVIGRRRYAVLGELALGNLDLAASANSPSAADRIEIDAETPRRIEEARSFDESSPLAGRREDDQMVAGVSQPRGAYRR